MSKYQNIEMQAERFKALGNPHRLILFQRLLACCKPGTICSTERAERLCVGDLGAGLDIAPSTLSHHIKELARAGLVCTARHGKSVECWVEPAVLEELASFFSSSFQLEGVDNV